MKHEYNLKIDPDIESLLTPLTEEEYSQLYKNLKKDRYCHTPIAVWQWKSLILDGHNRYKICKELNIKYKTRELWFDNKYEAMQWVILNQIGRRNLTKERKEHYINYLVELKKKSYDENLKNAKEAKEKVEKNNNEYEENKKSDSTRKEFQVDQKKPLETQDRVDVSDRQIHKEVANEVGVSRSTVLKATEHIKNVKKLKAILGKDFEEKINNKEIKFTKKDIKDWSLLEDEKIIELWEYLIKNNGSPKEVYDFFFKIEENKKSDSTRKEFQVDQKKPLETQDRVDVSLKDNLTVDLEPAQKKKITENSLSFSNQYQLNMFSDNSDGFILKLKVKDVLTEKEISSIEEGFKKVVEDVLFLRKEGSLHKAFVETFIDKYELKYNTKYFFNGGKDGSLIKKAIRLLDKDIILWEKIIDYMMRDDFWADVIDIGLAVSNITKVLPIINGAVDSKVKRNSFCDEKKDLSKYVYNQGDDNLEGVDL